MSNLNETGAVTQLHKDQLALLADVIAPALHLHALALVPQHVAQLRLCIEGIVISKCGEEKTGGRKTGNNEQTQKRRRKTRERTE